MQNKRHGQNMKAKHLLRRTGHAMSSHPDAAQDATMIKSMVSAEALKKKTGGAVEGRASGGRLDKMARGGRKAPNVTVNVINTKPTGDGMMAPPPPMPMAPPALPPGALPPPPMAGGPGPGPMGGPPPGIGGPMGGMKTGGRMQKRADGGEPTQGYSTKPMPKAPVEEKHLKAGGRAAPKMTAGAGSGEGRLEKSALVKEKPKAK